MPSVLPIPSWIHVIRSAILTVSWCIGIFTTVLPNCLLIRSARVNTGHGAGTDVEGGIVHLLDRIQNSLQGVGHRDQLITPSCRGIRLASYLKSQLPPFTLCGPASQTLRSRLCSGPAHLRGGFKNPRATCTAPEPRETPVVGALSVSCRAPFAQHF